MSKSVTSLRLDSRLWSRMVMLGVLMVLLCSAVPGVQAQQNGANQNQNAQQGSNVTGSNLPRIDLSVTPVEGKDDYAMAIQVLILLTILSFGPAFITMMTSFTRLIVVFSFLRLAMGTQQSPPNQVLVGLALFLTIYIMSPVFNQVNQQAIQPYLNDEVTQTEALDAAAIPLKDFMIKQTREKDLLLFMDLAGEPAVTNAAEIPLYVVVPSFVISELKMAFQIGFMIYLPFLVVDLVVASVLLAMGIIFLPPVLVSLPFKILIFVLTDGWYLIVDSMMRSFN
ncbi:MAG: flagellar type III secretion system pore protein FliP [Bacteroidota bacterium]